MTVSPQLMVAKLHNLWLVLTFRAGPVLFTTPGVERYFARCTACGRVFMHYWGCVTADDRAKGRQVGCKCGNLKMRISHLPVWQEGWFLLSRYVWRKLIRRQAFWDPRMAQYVNSKEVK